MSLILGFKTDDAIIIASDKRMVHENGTFSDDNNKLFEVNKCLAFTGAGNAAFTIGVHKKLKESVNKDIMTTDDLFEIAKVEYRTTKCACAIKKIMVPSFDDNSNTCCCFIAGCDKRNIPKLLFAHDLQNTGDLISTEIPLMIVSPPDMTFDNCLDLLKKNRKVYPLDFVECTIRGVAKTSKYVSATGDKWTFDLSKKCGKLDSF